MFSDAEDAERVVGVDGATLITERGSLVTTYYGVRGSFAIGDVLDERPQHRARVENRQWSPFDEPGAEDDPKGGRVF